MSNVVTITGYRQRGKTHAALAVAAADAHRGRDVVWVSRGLDLASEAFRQMLDHYLIRDLVERSWRGNGRQMIQLADPHGPPNRAARIRFTAPSSSAVRLTQITASKDTFIFDEAPLPYGFAQLNPDAHIYVTVLPPDGDYL